VDILSPNRDMLGIAAMLITIALAGVLTFLAWRFTCAFRADSESATLERLARAATAAQAHEPDAAAAWLQGECRRLGIAVPTHRAQSWVHAMRASAVMSGDEPALPEQAQPQPFIIKPPAPSRFADASTTNERLAGLACDAVRFLDQLKQKGPLTVRRSDAGVDVETDIAAAWLLTEVASCGLAVSTDEVGQALMAALEDRSSLSQLPSTQAGLQVDAPPMN
jgi:hypothetical protein